MVLAAQQRLAAANSRAGSVAAAATAAAAGGPAAGNHIGQQCLGNSASQLTTTQQQAAAAGVAPTAEARQRLPRALGEGTIGPLLHNFSRIATQLPAALLNHLAKGIADSVGAAEAQGRCNQAPDASRGD